MSLPFVFISYAHADSEKVLPIISALQKNGIRCIDGGRELPESVSEKVNSCTKFVALISKAYVTSQNCKTELNFAVSGNKELFSIYLEDIALSSGSEIQLSRCKSVYRKNFPSFEEFITALCSEAFFTQCKAPLTFSVASPKAPTTDYRAENKKFSLIKERVSITSHAVILLRDGSVFATGKNDFGQCNVSDWRDIRKVLCVKDRTYAMDKYGKVFSCGKNDYGQCNVSSWSNVADISASLVSTVGLRTDGTVVATGRNDDGQCNVSSWSDIVQIGAGLAHTVGLRADGRVVCAGSNRFNQSATSSWRDITKIHVTGYATFGIKKNGTVVATGINNFGELNVSGWTDIIDIQSYAHTVGLKKDGTLVATGNNGYGQCNVGNLYDIVGFDIAGYKTVALSKDGKVHTVGSKLPSVVDISPLEDVAACCMSTDLILISSLGKVKVIGEGANGKYAMLKYLTI